MPLLPTVPIGKPGGIMACALAHRANKIAYAMVRDQHPYDPGRIRPDRQPAPHRHEIARVLQPGGTYLSQQIGAGSAT